MVRLTFNIKKPIRQTYFLLFIILAAVLTFLPATIVFNDLLAKIVMKLSFYKYIENFVVPVEARLLGVILYPFGFAPRITGNYLAIGGDKPMLIEIAWNCIGWQSLLLFIITTIVILQGNKYSRVSKIKVWAIGVMGTILVNLLRLTIVALLAYYFGQPVAIIFHDYGSTLVVIVWLFIFWWFAHEFVMEEKV